MNRNDFIDLLEEKVQVNRQIIGEVYELIDMFPYFQSAHLLLLKGLKSNDDVKFEKQLRLSSIHIADREILYYQLSKKREIVPEKKTIPEEKIEGKIEAKVLEQMDESDHQQTVIESARNSEQLITEIERESEADRNGQSATPLQPHSHSILISMEDEKDDSEEVMTVIDEESSEEEEKIFFMDPGFSFPENGDLLELDAEAGKKAESDEDQMAETNAVNGSGSSKPLSQSELIDRFIITNPRIEPVRDPSKIPAVDISKPFAEFEGGLVTETLARIYVNQGYYSRAIEIYEKLSLKYPEKSSYFATQIELVKVHLKK
jgi:hypothetical protein